MLGPTSRTSLPLQVETNQTAFTQDAIPWRNSRFLWTSLGFAVLMLIGVSTCATPPLAQHAQAASSHLAAGVAFNPSLSALYPARHLGRSAALRPAEVNLAGGKQRQPRSVLHMTGGGGETSTVSRRDTLVGLAALFGVSEFGAPMAAHAATPVYVPAPGSLDGRTVLITGANTGLGLETAARLAAAGAEVIATGRTSAKAQYAVDEVMRRTGKKIRGVELDLGDLKSVSSFPQRLKGSDKIDVLVNNAGVMAIPDKLTTSNGFERQIGVNHLGHFALTAALMPLLENAGTFRVISVSSSANQGATKGAIEGALANNLDPKDYSQWGNYCLSKAFNVLFANELQRKFDEKGVKGSAVSLHPGVVGTDLARYLIGGTESAEKGVPLADTYATMNPIQKGLLSGLQKFVLTVPEGANTQVLLAAEPKLDQSGGTFFENMKPGKASGVTNDKEIAAKLWTLSEKLTGATIKI